MKEIDDFVAAVDKAFSLLCRTAAPDGRADGGGITTRYYALGARRAAVWFQCESFGGEISATVCGGDDVFTDPEKVAESMADDAGSGGE